MNNPTFRYEVKLTELESLSIQDLLRIAGNLQYNYRTFATTLDSLSLGLIAAAFANIQKEIEDRAGNSQNVKPTDTLSDIDEDFLKKL